MSKHREQKQGDTLQEIIECLGEARKSDNGVWVGKNYSLWQLKEDIKAIADKAEGKLGMHEGAFQVLSKQHRVPPAKPAPPEVLRIVNEKVINR